ncbi:MAG: DUF805 domain-containing protein [Proteobacteria bacterium]|nr:DUF805 domain-containing protein [Pseudomonadota bacterium]
MTNPYSATTVDLSEPLAGDDETYEPKIFAVNGRIGRLRYLAYSFGVMILLMLALGVLVGLAALVLGKGAAVAMGFLIYIPMIAVTFIMAKRRLNDLDQSGWLSLLSLVPLVNAIFGLYLIFAPGTKGSNSYGPPPVQNSTSVIMLSLIFPLVFVFGVLAAIAIPAYQQYTVRAKAKAALQAPTPAAETSEQGGKSDD